LDKRFALLHNNIWLSYAYTVKAVQQTLLCRDWGGYDLISVNKFLCSALSICCQAGFQLNEVSKTLCSFPSFISVLFKLDDRSLNIKRLPAKKKVRHTHLPTPLLAPVRRD